MNIIISACGTGGHIYPAIALAEKIVLDSKLDTYDQFLNAAKKEGNDE